MYLDSLILLLLFFFFNLWGGGVCLSTGQQAPTCDQRWNWKASERSMVSVGQRKFTMASLARGS